MPDLRVILLILLLAVTAGTSGQARLDSLRQRLATVPPGGVAAVETMVELSYDHARTGNMDSAAYYVDRATVRAEQLESDHLLGLASWARLQVDLATQGGEGESFARAAIGLIDEGLRPELVVATQGDLAFYLSTRQRCASAVREMRKADSLARRLTIPAQERTKHYLRYSFLLMNCERYELLPEVSREGQAIAVRNGDDRRLGAFYSTLAIAYSELERFDSAVHYLERYEALLPRIDNLFTYNAFYGYATQVYYDAGDYDKAYFFGKKGVELTRDSLGNREELIGPKRHYLSRAAFELGRTDEAAEEAAVVRSFFERSNNEKGLVENLELLGRIAERRGRYRDAAAYFRRSQLLNDSLNERKTRQRFDALTAEFETERIRTDLAEKQRDLSRAEARAYRNGLIGLALAVLLIVTGIVAAYLRARRRRLALEFEKRQAELRYNLLRARMNPHFIFNSLNAIQSFFASRKFEVGNDYLATFSRLLRRTLDQTGQPAISLHEELESLRLYLDLERSRLGERLDYEIHLSNAVEPEIMRVPPLILQPFVENAIWHGVAPKGGPGRVDIFIDYDEESDCLHCRIEDDGVGIVGKPDREGHRSSGVAITRERLGRGGRVTITDRHLEAGGKTGVRTELIIPLWD